MKTLELLQANASLVGNNKLKQMILTEQFDAAKAHQIIGKARGNYFTSKRSMQDALLCFIDSEFEQCESRIEDARYHAYKETHQVHIESHPDSLINNYRHALARDNFEEAAIKSSKNRTTIAR